MTEPSRNKGPWIHRFLTVLFSIFLALLCFWLTGFLVNDIGKWPGPKYQELEDRRLDQSRVNQADEVQREIADTERKITDQKASQALLRDSTANSQTTMNQLLEFQRLSLEKNVTPSAAEQKSLAESQQRFLANQAQYQTLNEELVQLDGQLRSLNETQRKLQETLKLQRKPIKEEFAALRRAHDLKVGALKLALLIPLLLVAVFLFVKGRNGPYAMIIYAFGAAVLLRAGLLMGEYFPSRYFKYILILTALAIVLRVLVHLIRTVASPKNEWLLKQYREAYEAFLCPQCSYPIRRGPLKFRAWTRRTIKKMTTLLPNVPETDEPYVCPVCSTQLYEECEGCHAVRHSLLPSCSSCGQLRSEVG